MRRKDHPTVHRGSQNWPIAQITLLAGGLSTSTLSGGVRGQRGGHVSLSQPTLYLMLGGAAGLGRLDKSRCQPDVCLRGKIV